MSDQYPRYSELPQIGPDAERYAWEFFGAGDELGTLNFITPEHIRASAAEVAVGEVVNLNLPLDEPQPQFWTNRPPLVHHREHRGNIRDDSIDSFQLQGSTQWDGLRHQRYREFGFYGGRQDEDLDGADELGIHVWSERGIIGRGVLVDVAAYLAAEGRPLVPDERTPITAALIEATLQTQNAELRPGDILLVRTGWLEWYLDLASGERTELVERLDADRSKAELPGIDPSRETIGWLWDHQVAALAFDNPTVDALPFRRAEGWAHLRLLTLLGMPLGELWRLDHLSEACRRHGRYTFQLFASPLNLRGGAGSPANAYAVL